MTFDEIIAQVRELQTNGLVEITGGEPLMQEGTPVFAQRLLDLGYTVLVETNGTQAIESLPEKAIRIVDVKCPESGGYFLMNNLSHLDPRRDQVKFVIADRIDYEFALDFARHYLPRQMEVLFSAVTDRLPLDRLAGWMLDDHCPYRLQLQLHKIIWEPNARGV
jgi:7-carboxy-7-deazaguanine synthase